MGFGKPTLWHLFKEREREGWFVWRRRGCGCVEVEWVTLEDGMRGVDEWV